MPLIDLEFVSVVVRIFIIGALVALLVASGRLYAAIKRLDVKVVTPYVKLAKYLGIFAAILCFNQVFWLLQWLHTWGYVTLPLTTSELGIIGAFSNILFVVGLLPMIITLFKSYYLVV